MTSCVDQELILRQLDDKRKTTSNPRVRAMLARVREHAAAEKRADLQGLMDTLSPNPEYHCWEPTGDTGPKGRDGVEEFYANYVRDRRQFLEVDCERIVADEDCVVLETVLKAIFPGPVMAAHPLAAFMDVQTDQHYLFTGRVVVFWPFDQDAMILGEDSYSGGPYDVRVLSDDELPEGYKALFADA